MWYRRAIYRTQFWAALVLPAFMLVARSAIGGGWGFLGYLFIVPVLAVALGAVAGITRARRSARSARAVSQADAVILTLWYVAIVGHSIAWMTDAAAALAVIGVLLGLGAFWNSIAQLVREARQSVEAVLGGFEAPSVPPQQGYDPRIDDGPVIRIDPSDR